LRLAGWRVLVFDNSGVWSDISDLPYYLMINPNQYYYKTQTLDESTIYDISNLIPEDQQIFTDLFLQDVWNNRFSYGFGWLMIILEEAQLYARNIRGKVTQNLLRICSAGRNRQVRTLAITPDLALIDPSIIRLCGQRYHGRLGIEENSKRKFRSYYGKQVTDTATKLETGQFLYLNRNKLEVVRVPLFEPVTQPQQYIEPKPQKKTLLQRIFG
jgi:DNA helicase HerA-like ATPase